MHFWNIQKRLYIEKNVDLKNLDMYAFKQKESHRYASESFTAWGYPNGLPLSTLRDVGSL